jgi:sulfur relay (sulfurtransferase) DsrC/TusE family protein
MPRSEYDESENDSENESEYEPEYAIKKDDDDKKENDSQSGESVDSEMMDSEMEDYIPTKSFKEAVKQIFRDATKEATKEATSTSEKLIMDLRKFYLDFEKSKDLNMIDKKIIYSICNEIMKKC